MASDSISSKILMRTGHFSQGMTPEQIAAVLKKLCKEYDVAPLAFGVQHFSKDHDANKKVFDLGQAAQRPHVQRRPRTGQPRQPGQVM